VQLLHLFCSLAQFVEQPCVLYCDDRLSGEVLEKFDLLIAEWADLLTIGDDYANQLVLFQHWDGQERPHASKFNCSNGMRIALEIVLRSRKIVKVDHHLRHKHSADGIFVSRMKRSAPAELREPKRHVATCNKVQRLAIPAVDRSELGVAQQY